jgi:Ca2+-transporting ATPase
LLTAIAIVFFTALQRSVPEEQARALAFVCLVTGSSGLMISSRSAFHGLPALLRMRNQVQWWILAGTGAGLAAALAVPALQKAFHFAPVSMPALTLAVLAGLAVVAWFELVKSVLRTRHWAGDGGAVLDKRET